MLPTKLNLIGRELDDIQREFTVLLTRIQAGTPANATPEQVEKLNKAWNEDLNGWVNWVNSLRK